MLVNTGPNALTVVLKQKMVSEIISLRIPTGVREIAAARRHRPVRARGTRS